MNNIPDNINTPELLQKYYDVSINRENDEYSYHGVNISAQKRRQALVPWTKIYYNKKNDTNENNNIDTNTI